MRHGGHWPAFGAVVLLLPGVSAVHAQDRYMEDYRAGIAAMESGDWAEAASLMRVAIEKQPAARKRRLRRQTYMPHFQLGRALAEMNDCQAGLAAFDESLRQGVLENREEMVVANRKREYCTRRLALIDDLGAQARETLRRVDALAVQVGVLSTTPVLAQTWRRGSPSFDARVAAADRALEYGRQHTDGAGTDRIGELQEALEVLEEVDVVYRQIRDQASSLRATLVGEQRDEAETIEQLRLEIVDLVNDAQRQRSSIEQLRPYPRGVRRALADLEGLLEENRERTDDPALDSRYFEGLRNRLSNSLREMQSVSLGPGPLLMQAADAFVAGDDGHAVDLLRNAAFRDARRRAHGSLLLSAALYRLYRRDGESDDALLADAGAAAVASREAVSDIEPGQIFLSPEFLEFFAESVLGAGI